MALPRCAACPTVLCCFFKLTLVRLLCCQALERNPLATVLHGVDATRLAQSLPGPRERYDTVLWNFPYPVRMKIAKGAVGRGLIEAFFESVKDVLTPEGKMGARGAGARVADPPCCVLHMCCACVV